MEKCKTKHSSSSVDDDQLNIPDTEFLKVVISILHVMLKGKPADRYGCINCYMAYFLNKLNSADRLETLFRSGLIETFVMLRSSKYLENRKQADVYIRYLLKLITAGPTTTEFIDERASVVLQLCLCLRKKFSIEDTLYQFTVRNLRDLAEKGNYVLRLKYEMDVITQIPHITSDVAEKLMQALHWCITSPSSEENTELFSSRFRDFKAFSRVLFNAIQELNSDTILERNCAGKFGSLYCIFHDLLDKMAKRLRLLQLDLSSEGKINDLTEEGKVNEEKVQPEWPLYLDILAELNFISKLYEGAEEQFWGILKASKFSLRALVVRFANRADGHDYRWLFEHNDMTDSESRMHLATVMIPGVKEPDAELIKELVDWSQNLGKGQFGVFKDKKLSEPQELQNWLRKSCTAIFNPKNPLFRACPDNPLSFYLNPDAGFIPQLFHYECVEFAGKVIALALMLKVTVGIALDRELLLQLEDSSHTLVPFFAKGFRSVLGISTKELLSFRGLKLDDINGVLCGHWETSPSHQNVENINGKREREASVDPLFSQYQNVKRLGRHIKNWRRGSKLGSGSYGEVYKGLADPDGFLLAAKAVPLKDTHKVRSIEHEIGLLCQLHHENIVEYYGTKKEEEHLYIFLEFVNGGSLYSVYKEYTLNDSLVSCYTKQTLEGLKHLHERKVMHGDIKCENILLNEDGCVKIADFGLPKVTELRSLRKSGRGSTAWSAPEVFNPMIGEYGLEADIWSLGCTVLEMLTRESPYTHLEPCQIEKGIIPTIPDSLSDNSRNFILQCLQVDPKKRPTAAELLEHPFVKTS